MNDIKFEVAYIIDTVGLVWLVGGGVVVLLIKLFRQGWCVRKVGGRVLGNRVEGYK